MVESVVPPPPLPPSPSLNNPSLMPPRRLSDHPRRHRQIGHGGVTRRSAGKKTDGGGDDAYDRNNNNDDNDASDSDDLAEDDVFGVLFPQKKTTSSSSSSSSSFTVNKANTDDIHNNRQQLSISHPSSSHRLNSSSEISHTSTGSSSRGSDLSTVNGDINNRILSDSHYLSSASTPTSNTSTGGSSRGSDLCTAATAMDHDQSQQQQSNMNMSSSSSLYTSLRTTTGPSSSSINNDDNKLSGSSRGSVNCQPTSLRTAPMGTSRLDPESSTSVSTTHSNQPSRPSRAATVAPLPAVSHAPPTHVSPHYAVVVSGGGSGPTTPVPATTKPKKTPFFPKKQNVNVNVGAPAQGGETAPHSTTVTPMSTSCSAPELLPVVSTNNSNQSPRPSLAAADPLRPASHAPTQAESTPPVTSVESFPPVSPANSNQLPHPTNRSENDETETTKARLTRFYAKYNPEKLSEVDMLAEKWNGRVQVLFRALSSKYGPEPAAVPVTPVATANNTNITKPPSNIHPSPTASIPDHDNKLSDDTSSPSARHLSSSSTTTLIGGRLLLQDGSMVRAKYQYKAAGADEISFEKGDVFVCIRKGNDPGWYMGVRRRDGVQGLFPGNYVDVVDTHLLDPPTPATSSTNMNRTSLIRTTTTTDEPNPLSISSPPVALVINDEAKGKESSRTTISTNNSCGSCVVAKKIMKKEVKAISDGSGGAVQQQETNHIIKKPPTASASAAATADKVDLPVPPSPPSLNNPSLMPPRRSSIDHPRRHRQIGHGGTSRCSANGKKTYDNDDDCDDDDDDADLENDDVFGVLLQQKQQGGSNSSKRSRDDGAEEKVLKNEESSHGAVAAVLQQKSKSPGFYDRLHRFYLKYNPQKISSIGETLNTFKGREEVMFNSLQSKYGPEPPESEDDVGSPTGSGRNVKKGKGHHQGNTKKGQPCPSLTLISEAPEAAVVAAAPTSSSNNNYGVGVEAEKDEEEEEVSLKKVSLHAASVSLSSSHTTKLKGGEERKVGALLSSPVPSLYGSSSSAGGDHNKVTTSTGTPAALPAPATPSTNKTTSVPSAHQTLSSSSLMPQPLAADSVAAAVAVSGTAVDGRGTDMNNNKNSPPIVTHHSGQGRKRFRVPMPTTSVPPPPVAARHSPPLRPAPSTLLTRGGQVPAPQLSSATSTTVTAMAAAAAAQHFGRRPYTAGAAFHPSATTNTTTSTTTPADQSQKKGSTLEKEKKKKKDGMDEQKEEEGNIISSTSSLSADTAQRLLPFVVGAAERLVYGEDSPIDVCAALGFTKFERHCSSKKKASNNITAIIEAEARLQLEKVKIGASRQAKLRLTSLVQHMISRFGYDDAQQVYAQGHRRFTASSSP